MRNIHNETKPATKNITNHHKDRQQIINNYKSKRFVNGNQAKSWNLQVE